MSINTGSEISVDDKIAGMAQDAVGAIATEVFSKAIINAVESAEGAYGFPAFRDL